MYVKKLIIENFRGIRNMELELHPRMNVFIGVNGAGKSSVLDALAYLLMPAVQHFCGLTQDIVEFVASRGSDFPEHEIHNNEDFSELAYVIAKEGLQDQSWYIGSSRFRQAHGRNVSRSNRIGLSQDRWLPYFESGDKKETCIIVYYRVRRAVDNVSLEAWANRNFRKQDAFVDALAPRIDFKEFFEWFRNREDLENEDRVDGKNKPDRFLQPVRDVISVFLDSVSEVRIRRRDPLRMVVIKNEQELRIEQLSDGEKCLLALVGDLARRLAIANPSLENPLHGEGIVLIDEIDLHLHPQWQRMILPKLAETFPNCQFIVTTHSPQVLGEIRSENIFILADGKNGIEAKRPAYEIYGQTSGTLLEDMMQTPERNGNIKDRIKDAYEALELGNVDDAKRHIGELREVAADIPDLVRLDMRLSRKEVVGK